MIRGAAPADGDAAVVGVHRVEDEEAEVAEDLLAGPADLVPEGVGERLGADHQRVDRHERALVAGQLGRERLGGAHDDVGAHVAERRGRDVRLEAGDGGALVDGHPQPLDDVGEPAGEPGRVDGGAVRRVAGAEAPGHLDALAHVGGAEHPVVLLAEAPRALVLDRLAHPQQLHRRECEVQLAAEVEARVDALVVHDARDLVHRLVQGALLVDDRLPAVRPGGELTGAGKVVWHQPPLRPEAPKPAISRSSTAIRRCGSALLEVVGGPQAGEAGAHDGDVDVDGPGREGRGVSSPGTPSSHMLRAR